MRKNKEMKQTCKVCNRPDILCFHVPDETWEAIVPKKYRKKVACLWCFDEFAARKDIYYANQLRELHFVGDKSTIEFSIKSHCKSKNIEDLLKETFE